MNLNLSFEVRQRHVRLAEVSQGFGTKGTQDSRFQGCFFTVRKMAPKSNRSLGSRLLFASILKAPGSRTPAFTKPKP